MPLRKIMIMMMMVVVVVVVTMKMITMMMPQVRRYVTAVRARTNSLSTSYSRPQPFYYDDDGDDDGW